MSGEAGRSEEGRASWVLLLRSGEPGVLDEAAAMTAAAVSLGLAVTLVWLDGALEALVSGRFDADADEDGSAGPLLREARETGRVRYLACSAAAVRAKPGLERVREKVDQIVGWPTAVSLVRAAEKSFVW